MRASSAIVEPASSSRRTWSLNSLVNVRRVRRRGLEVGMGLLSRASQLNFLYQFWVASPNSLYATTWSVQALEVSPSSAPLCAVAVPGAPSNGAFPFSITTATSSGTGFAAAYPCTQQIEFAAYPQPSPGASASPSRSGRRHYGCRCNPRHDCGEADPLSWTVAV